VADLQRLSAIEAEKVLAEEVARTRDLLS
jgi:hypothetical protein